MWNCMHERESSLKVSECLINRRKIFLRCNMLCLIVSKLVDSSTFSDIQKLIWTCIGLVFNILCKNKLVKITNKLIISNSFRFITRCFNQYENVHWKSMCIFSTYFGHSHRQVQINLSMSETHWIINKFNIATMRLILAVRFRISQRPIRRISSVKEMFSKCCEWILAGLIVILLFMQGKCWKC